MRNFQSGALTLDTNNVGVETAPISTTDAGEFTVFICPHAGTHGTHKIMIRISPDGSEDADFIDLEEVTGGQFLKRYDYHIDYIKFKVTLAEGQTSSCKVFVNGR